jgi:hypothetical protein
MIDCLREVMPPFSPEVVSKEFAELLLSYSVSFCLADKFAGEWLSEQFSKWGVRVDQSAKSKSELYIDLLATLSSGRIDLLDHPKSIDQICSLERRNRSGGRQQIDSPVGQHEDIANVIAGLVSSSFFKYNLNSMGSGYEDDEQSKQILAERKERAEIRAKYGSRGRVDYIFDSEADRKKVDAPVYRDINGYRTDTNGDQILGEDGKPYR